jgi:hypothetical protein
MSFMLKGFFSDRGVLLMPHSSLLKPPNYGLNLLLFVLQMEAEGLR